MRAGSESLELEDVSVEDVTAGTGAMAQVAAATIGDSGVYTLDERGSATSRVTVYSPHADEQAVIRLSYTVTNAVNAWADTAELYWKFVGSSWEVASESVTCRVHLPVPAGELGWFGQGSVTS